MGRHLPPDHSKGDANTIGGYMAVHDRPAAFEGSDGRSYSVDIATDEAGGREGQWGGYLLFVQWSSSDPSPTGHLESDFLAFADSARAARAQVAALSLSRVREVLEALIHARDASRPRERPWWDAMRDDAEGGE